MSWTSIPAGPGNFHTLPVRMDLQDLVFLHGVTVDIAIPCTEDEAISYESWPRLSRLDMPEEVFHRYVERKDLTPREVIAVVHAYRKRGTPAGGKKKAPSPQLTLL